jgi:tetratricopeptide (TPR) repeat protein
MSQTKLGLSALALELGAWAQLAVAGASDQALATYLAAHGGAAALLALFALALLPAGYRAPRLPVLLLLFAVIFFIPALGFIGTLGVILLAPWLPRLKTPASFGSVELPALDPHERIGGAGFRQPGMRGFLSNATAPVSTRLRALVSLQNVPTRLASPLLRDLLADPSEDLRLLAYGMLDSREQKLNRAIHRELRKRKEAADAEVAAHSARKLTQLYWELTYQGLVQGELLRHAVGEALRYAQEALALDPADANLTLRLGRLLHAQGRNDEARKAYGEALRLGLPATRVIPYLAELAFEARDHDEVRRLLAVLRDWPGMPRLQPVIQYWTRT